MCVENLPKAPGDRHAYIVIPGKNFVGHVTAETVGTVISQMKKRSLSNITEDTDFLLLPGVTYDRLWPPRNMDEVSQGTPPNFDPHLAINRADCSFDVVYDIGPKLGAYNVSHIKVSW